MLFKRIFLMALLAVIYTLGITTVPAEAADSRTEQIYLNQGASRGNPSTDGNFIVWAESWQSSTYPCYYNLQTGEKGIINPAVRVPNGIRLRIDDGLAVYPNYTYKELWGTNLSNVTRFDLEPGQSRILFATENEIGLWTVLGDSIVVFSGGGIFKDLYWLQPEAATLLMENLKGRDLFLYSCGGQEGCIWVERDSNQLYTCSFASGSSAPVPGLLVEMGMLDVGEGKMVYRISGNGWQIYDLTTAAKTALPVNGLPAFSMDDQYLYYYKDAAIWKMNLLDQSERQLLEVADAARGMDCCNGELVYKCNQVINWQASLVSLTPDLEAAVWQPGQTVPLQAVAVYRNGYSETLSSEVIWDSSVPQVAEIQNELVLAKQAGTAEISGEYEGITARVLVTVKELESVAIMPALERSLQIGETVAFTAYGQYSDGSSTDITAQANWACTGNNEINSGLFTAGEEGSSLITATYDGITATITVTVEAPLPPEPPAPSEPDTPVPQPPPESEPSDDPPPPSDLGPEGSVIIIYSSGSTHTTDTNMILKAIRESVSNPLLLQLELMDNKLRFSLNQDILDLMEKRNQEIHLGFTDGILILIPGFLELEAGEEVLFELHHDGQHLDQEIVKSRYKSLRQVSPVYKLSVTSSRDKLVELKFPVYFQYLPDGYNFMATLYQYNDEEVDWESRPLVVLSGGKAAYALNMRGEYTLLTCDELFYDSSQHWAAQDISFASRLQLLSGVKDGCFEPDRPINQDVFLEALEQLLIKTNPDLAALTCDSINPALPAASEPYLPANPGIYREQMAALLYERLKPIQDLSVPALSGRAQLPYADEAQITPPARQAVEALTRLGLIRGTDQNSFNPGSFLTRAEAAAIFHRLHDLLQ